MQFKYFPCNVVLWMAQRCFTTNVGL